ncbi:hypothetical protein MIR68_001985 [Amoeboaphelidium protococcarum]|nr:hypothetical protein MIR68_001985 [Amoeboaphelidium protococcarum]KAI3644006.1 hypothetical protein MP228_010170 [Amoeboaphelidium protococcarum]
MLARINLLATLSRTGKTYIPVSVVMNGRAQSQAVKSRVKQDEEDQLQQVEFEEANARAQIMMELHNVPSSLSLGDAVVHQAVLSHDQSPASQSYEDVERSDEFDYE